jgi:hypothetical protein
MDRHNTPTHLLEIIYCSYIADYYLKSCIFVGVNILWITGSSKGILEYSAQEVALSRIILSGISKADLMAKITVC